MQIVILGAGRVGESAAESLVLERNDITVIDTDPVRLRALQRARPGDGVQRGGGLPEQHRPGLGQVGPAGNYAGLTDLQTLVSTLAMLLGRLELLSVLVLLPRSSGAADGCGWAFRRGASPSLLS